MASRRTRIKGIANIPQRRKTNATNDEQYVPPEKIEESANENYKNTITPAEDDKRCDEISDKELNCNSSNEHTSKIISVIDNSPDVEATTVSCAGKSEINCESFHKNEIPLQHKPSLDVDLEQLHNTNTETNTNNVPQSDQKPKLPLFRRKCIKPMISASVINRKPKEKIDKGVDKSWNLIDEKCLHLNDKLEPQMEVTNVTAPKKSVILNKNVLDLNAACEIINKEQGHISIATSNIFTRTDVTSEVTLNETLLTPHNEVLKTEVPLDKGIKKLIPCSNNSTLETEYPPPPPSPSKINRSRIKAIPRLGYRKTSVSASESEDESKRNYNGNRNDSVCSTTSGITESFTECMSPQRPKEFNSIIQKKCNRTEQSRKLAEARREFQRRFGNDKPDRQKLTMIDLIFYNPTTNPMKDDAKSKQVEFNQGNEDIQVDNESEKVDDPQNMNEDVSKSDEENEMPVPQIKIGPSGEIILDEKSLVIESKEVKKQREELQKTQLVDGDFDTSYGIYKRQKRSKNWTQCETLRFYKALNTIGTDFTLMCELFPRRTRRELKMKFKKEERINRSLINRAIMKPCSFDFVELKHEVDMEEKELEELQKLKEDHAKLKKQKNEEKTPKKRKVIKDQDTEKVLVKSLQPKPPKIRKIKQPRMKKLNIESVLEDSDADESDIETQSESEDEISMPLRPTRSGRVPKVAKKFDCTEPTSIENIIKTNKVSDVKPDSIEPGSIMIITEKGPNDEPIYKIYMVTPDQTATPVNLTADIVSKAIEFKKGLTAQNIVTISANVTDDEAENTTKVEENNITIPADESVTTLKGGNISNENTVLEQCNNTPEENNVTYPAD